MPSVPVAFLDLYHPLELISAEETSHITNKSLSFWLGLVLFFQERHCTPQSVQTPTKKSLKELVCAITNILTDIGTIESYKDQAS